MLTADRDALGVGLMNNGGSPSDTVALENSTMGGMKNG